MKRTNDLPRMSLAPEDGHEIANRNGPRALNVEVLERSTHVIVANHQVLVDRGRQKLLESKTHTRGRGRRRGNGLGR